METLNLNSKVNNARKILLWVFGLVPILAGLDKFFNLLTDWEKYLGPLKEYLPFAPHTFMMIVVVIEIIAGILVFIITRIGAYIVAAWLFCISIVLISGMYYDIAVRDLAMALSAFCLGQLSSTHTKE
jgi:uncharacterized membrane protein YphA (DoxX/SURF4 family)